MVGPSWTEEVPDPDRPFEEDAAAVWRTIPKGTIIPVDIIVQVIDDPTVPADAEDVIVVGLTQDLKAEGFEVSGSGVTTGGDGNVLGYVQITDREIDLEGVSIVTRVYIDTAEGRIGYCFYSALVIGDEFAAALTPNQAFVEQFKVLSPNQL